MFQRQEKIAMPYLNIILKAIGMIEYTKYRNLSNHAKHTLY